MMRPFLMTTTPRVALSVNAKSIKVWTFLDAIFWLSGETDSHVESGKYFSAEFKEKRKKRK